MARLFRIKNVRQDDEKLQQSNWNPPGSLIYVGENELSNVTINIVDYSETFYSEIEVQNIEHCKDNTEEENTVTWVDIRGLNNPKTIEEIGKYFGIHRMWLEDVLNTEHLPKAEEVDDLLFIIMKAVRWDEGFITLEYDQVSLFLGKNFVISFHENPIDIFEPVKTRIRQGKGRIRSMKADYLFYALVDSIVDKYLDASTIFESKIEDLDTVLNEEFSENLSYEVRRLKYELTYLKKAAAPLRDSIGVIARSEIEELDEKTKMYFKDVYEHAVTVMAQLDSFREMLNGLSEAYNQKMNIRLNEVLRVLTVFTAIFSPLTFIVGVYGMNFKNLPELNWEYGYYIIWLIMFFVFLSMIIFFKRKKWI